MILLRHGRNQEQKPGSDLVIRRQKMLGFHEILHVIVVIIRGTISILPSWTFYDLQVHRTQKDVTALQNRLKCIRKVISAYSNIRSDYKPLGSCWRFCCSAVIPCMSQTNFDHPRYNLRDLPIIASTLARSLPTFFWNPSRSLHFRLLRDILGLP
jgi:hypothetical protein